MAWLEAVQRYCRAKLGSQVDAEDAAQEAFLRFLERGGEDVINPEAWLIRAASFECRDHFRRRRREQAADERHRPAVGSHPVDPEHLVAERLFVDQVMQQLPPRDRELLALRYLADFSVEQLASRLNVSEGNARIMAHRARRRALGVLQAIGGSAAVLLVVGLGLRWAARRARRAGQSVARRAADAGRVLHEQAPLQQFGMLHLLVPTLVGAVVGTTSTTAVGWGASADSRQPAVTGANASRGAAEMPLATGSARGTAAWDRAFIQRTTANGPAASVNASSGLVGGALNPGAGASQQDVAFSSLSPSPSYGQDHTVIASGTFVHKCFSTCEALFVTTDGGHSWTNLHPSGFLGGTILVPPAFQVSHTLFAAGPVGLQESDDGGHSFRLVVPGGVAAAVLPDSPSRVLLGGNRLLVYDATSGLTSPGPSLPAAVTTVDSLVITGPDEASVVSGKVVDPRAPAQQDGVLLHCDAFNCTLVASFPGQLGWRLTASSDSVLAYLQNAAEVSTDGGAHFERADPRDPVSATAQVTAMAMGPGETSPLYVIASEVTRAGERAMVNSTDGGRTFGLIAAHGIPAEILLTSVIVLPGHVVMGTLGTPDPQGAFGVRCSRDGGLDWAAQC